MSTTATDAVTRDSLLETIAPIAEAYDRLLAQMSDPLSAATDDGGWSVRQLLSHVIGGWNRVPVMGGYYLSDSDGLTVPIVTHNDYWISEFEHAPVAAFRVAQQAAYAANVEFLEGLDESRLDRVLPTEFGDMSLAAFLMAVYQSHLGGHIDQLRGHSQ